MTISLQRFFGECSDEYEGVTELGIARGECGIIQVLTNKWNAENPDVQVETRVVDWGEQYTRLAASMAAGDPADIAIMHARYVARYAKRGLLMPLDDLMEAEGFDLDDYVPTAVDNATYDGKWYGVPQDAHTTLAFINVDLFEQAGLVDENGEPMIPTGREEFMAAAEQVKQETGKHFAILWNSWQSSAGIEFTPAFVWQQGGDLYDSEGNPTLDTPEYANALEFQLELFDKGYADPLAESGQTAFINGEVAVFLDGNWAIDSISSNVEAGEAAFEELRVVPFFTVFDQPAVWGSSHFWVLPMRMNPDPAKRLKAL